MQSRWAIGYEAVCIGLVVLAAGGAVLWRAHNPVVGRQVAPSVASGAARLGVAPSNGGTQAAHKPQVYDSKPEGGFQAGISLRPMDTEIFDAIAKGGLDRNAHLDLFPGRPYHVKLIGSLADQWIGMVVIDMERDGKWDERWKLKEDRVERTVFRDEFSGGMEVMYTLNHGRWQPH
jgi:hypothetical protein